MYPLIDQIIFYLWPTLDDIPCPDAEDMDDLSVAMVDRSLLRCKSIILSERHRLSFMPLFCNRT